MTVTDTSTLAPTCPYAHGAAAPQRSSADEFVRRLLRVPQHSGASQRSAVTAFRRSMVISTIRCTMTYLVFPFVLPALGLVTGVGQAVGMVIGVLAIVCDIFAIRRFFAVDHTWRWHFSIVALAVSLLLAVLLVEDVVRIVG